MAKKSTVSSFYDSKGNSTFTIVDKKGNSSMEKYDKNGNLVARGYTTSATTRSAPSLSTISSVLKIIIALLLMMLIFNIANGKSEIPTFSGLLNKLQSAPNFASNEIFQKGVLRAPNIDVTFFGVNLFGWLNDIMFYVVKVLNFLIFLIVCATNVITFVLWAVPYIFGF